MAGRWTRVSATAVGEEFDEIGTLSPARAIGLSDGRHEPGELVLLPPFQRIIAFEPLLAGFQRVADGHLTASNSLAGFDALAFFLVAVAQAQFGHADPIRLERFPNQLAAQPDSPIMVSRLNEAHEIGRGCFLPARVCIPA